MLKTIKELLDSDKLLEFVGDNRDMIKKVAAAAVLVVAAFFVFLFMGKEEEETIAKENPQLMETEAESTMIMVDIGGEVNNPMVVELKEGCRVEDAINAAGGITANADLTEINRAAFVEDGEKILIPSKNSESVSGDPSVKGAVSYSDKRVNINTADSDELQQLNGVGPVTAEKIIEYRESNGRFKAVEDIKNVSGIGDKTFEKFENDIRVN